MISTRKVTIITGTYNNPEVLFEYLKTLHRHTPKGFRLILIDNGDNLASREIIKEFRENIFTSMTVLNLHNKYSFAQYNNIALEKATTKYVLYLNDDVILSDNWLTSMVEVLERRPKVGAVSKKMFYRNGKPQWHCESRRGGYVKVAPATCLLVRRELARFDNYYEGYYFEDLDLIARIKSKGYKIWAERKYPIIHIGRATSEKVAPEEMAKLVEKNNKRFKTKKKLYNW